MVEKIALFVEGKSELIFVKSLLLKISNCSKIKISCWGVLADNNLNTESFSYCSPPVKIEILLVKVGGDEKVASVIKSRAQGLFSQGFTTIWGLRDMYSKEYDKQSKGQINNSISNKVITNITKSFAETGLNGRVHIFFSVMELEAWFLSFHEALSKMGLPIEEINKVIKKDITKIDPETEFFHPKLTLALICSSILKKSYKEAKFAHGLSTKIHLDEIKSLAKSGKVFHFRKFYGSLEKKLRVCN